MNQYLLSVYDDQREGAAAPPTPEEMQGFMGRVIALEEEMDRAGAFAFGGALHGPDAATVVRGGTGLDKVTTDGPYVEAKEHIGGFYVINAEDLDEALAWAEKVVEAINHAIEVRPFRATGRVQAGH
ncbi:MAG: YciI family protein [Nocardioidaceae bacterium]